QRTTVAVRRLIDVKVDAEAVFTGDSEIVVDGAFGLGFQPGASPHQVGSCLEGGDQRLSVSGTVRSGDLTAQRHDLNVDDLPDLVTEPTDHLDVAGADLGPPARMGADASVAVRHRPPDGVARTSRHIGSIHGSIATPNGGDGSRQILGRIAYPVREDGLVAMGVRLD